MTAVAMLGAGFMGSTHARALASIEGVTIAAIYARSAERGGPLANEIGAAFTQSLDDIFADPAIDAVDICLPTPLHRDMTERAIAAGKHVLLEKPIALTLEDADALVDLSARTDRVLMIAHVLRFWPEYVRLHQLTESGDYGDPVSAVAYRRQPFPAWSDLLTHPEQTGGAIIDMLVHDFDALNWLLGEPVSVVAHGRRNVRYGGWDQAQVLIEYAGGRSAVVDGGMLMPESYPFTSSLQLLLDRGALEYHFQAGGRSVEMGQGRNELLTYPTTGEPHTIAGDGSDAYRNELQYFIECVETGQPAMRATPAAARSALRVALAAKQSLESGSFAPVKI